MVFAMKRQEKTEQTTKKLRELGLKSTRARLLLYQTLESREGSFTPKEVHELMSETSRESVDLVSVYRNLAHFEEVGLVHQLTEGTYRLCRHSSCHAHPHIIMKCESCGESEEVSNHSSALFKQLPDFSASRGFLKRVSLLTLSGRCQRCA